MSRGFIVISLVIFSLVSSGEPSSLLCGRTKEVELGAPGGSGAALALTLARPSASTSRAPCQLRLTASDATAFTLRLIDVKESLLDWEKPSIDLDAPEPVPGAPIRKWGAKAAHVQDTTTDQAAPVTNNTDACKLFVYIFDSKTPIWKLSLCGANAGVIAARAGTKLLPPKLRIVWNPPTTPFQHTEKLRLVVTVVNSGTICTSDSQFVCGMTSLCISTYLVCDGVRHCPGGEDEDSIACAHRKDPLLLELLRRFAARNQEMLGIDDDDNATKPSVIMKISESEQRPNALMEFAAALKPYGPWSYLVVGMLICATILMFCLAWECCCKRTKPSDTPLSIPPSCLPPSVAVTSSSASPLPSPPQYDPPPSYAELFPRAYKSNTEPHCSTQPD